MILLLNVAVLRHRRAKAAMLALVRLEAMNVCPMVRTEILCALLSQETVEPLMEQYKPPGLIKKMYFKNLSFGDAPFKIENIWVEDEGEKHVLMEVRTCLS